MNIVNLVIIFISIGVTIVGCAIIACFSYKYEISNVSKENLKLIKFKINKI